MFLALNLDDTFDIVNNMLRGLTAWLCEFIYPQIAKFYKLFEDIGTIAYSDGMTAIYNRISLIIGIFMVFRITFWLIELLISPDRISDKEKNPTNIIKKVFLALILLATTPTIFKKAFDLQYDIVEKNIIGKIITGNEETVDSEDAGKQIAANLFINFYTISEDANLSDDDSCMRFVGEEGDLYYDLRHYGELDLSSACVTERTEKNKGPFKIDFNGLFAVGVGAIVLWMIIMYCISVAARAVQLIYLQIIAPIPIMCYLAPGKDNMFTKWLKQCTTTYLDLFIRIAIINFVMLLSSEILSNNNNFILNSLEDAEGWMEIFLVLGLLIFAKKAPELIQELLPKSVTKASGDFGLSWKKRTDNMLGGKLVYGASTKPIGFAAALPGVALSAGVRAFNASKYNQRENEKLGRYRSRRINELKTERDKKLGDPNMSGAQRIALGNYYDREINKLRNASNGSLRRGLRKDTNSLISQYNSTNDDAKKAELIEQINKNRDSGMGHRSQVMTAASSVVGGTLRAASAAIHEKSFGQIVKKANESQVKHIMQEQGWYKDGGYASFGTTVQRTISQVQRKFGIETEGQATQYVIDSLEQDVKAQEEVVNKQKEIEQGYSSSKSSVKTVESEGSADLGKNKGIKVYDPLSDQMQEIKFSTRTGMMKSTLERAKEYYNNLPTDESMKTIAGNQSSSSYKVLTNLIESISVNSSHKLNAQQETKNKLTEILNNSDNFENAFNSILTVSEQEIGKAEGDYGKLQAAAGLLTHMFKDRGITINSQYSNQTISNEYESLMRELKDNPERYSPYIMGYKEQIEHLLDGKNSNDYNEDLMEKLKGLWGDLKERLEIEQAEQARKVAEYNDELISKRHLVNDTKSFVEMKDKLNADKYGGKG